VTVSVGANPIILIT